MKHNVPDLTDMLTFFCRRLPCESLSDCMNLAKSFVHLKVPRPPKEYLQDHLHTSLSKRHDPHILNLPLNFCRKKLENCD